MKARIFIVLIMSLAVISCGEYEKLLKSADYDLKKAKAKEYYDAGQYVKSSEVLSQIIPRFRASAESEDLNWMNAMCFYGMKDYYMASSLFKSFIEQFPFGKYAEEGNYMAAYCDYKMSPRPELDQESTRSAIEGFRLFITRFPNSPKVEESRGYIKELEEKLVEKSYLSARLYYDRKEYKAAVTALTNSLKEYADTKYREEMMFLKLNSLYLYAFNSLPSKQRERYQDTLDDYFSFMEEFPESEYAKDVAGIYEKTNRFLQSAGVATTQPTGANN